MGKGRAGGGMGGGGGIGEQARREIAQESRRNRAIDLRAMTIANRPLGTTLEGQARGVADSNRTSESLDRSLRVSRNLLLDTQRRQRTEPISGGDMLQLRYQVMRDARALRLRGGMVLDGINRRGWHTAREDDIQAIAHYFASTRSISQLRSNIGTLTRQQIDGRGRESVTVQDGRRNSIAALVRASNIKYEVRQFGRDFVRAGG